MGLIGILLFKFTALLSRPHIHGAWGQSTDLLSLEVSLLPETKDATLMGLRGRLRTEQTSVSPGHFCSAEPLEGELFPSGVPRLLPSLSEHHRSQSDSPPSPSRKPPF